MEDLEFGAYLGYVRHQILRVTLDGLSNLTGVSPSQLNKIENGSSLPTRETVLKIAAGIGIEEENLPIFLRKAGYNCRLSDYELFRKYRGSGTQLEFDLEPKRMDDVIAEQLVRDGRIPKKQVQKFAEDLAAYCEFRIQRFLAEEKGGESDDRCQT